jgi:hypothetical protein
MPRCGTSKSDVDVDVDVDVAVAVAVVVVGGGSGGAAVSALAVAETARQAADAEQARRAERRGAEDMPRQIAKPRPRHDLAGPVTRRHPGSMDRPIVDGAVEVHHRPPLAFRQVAGGASS